MAACCSKPAAAAQTRCWAGERQVEKHYERVFVVAAPLQRVWRAFTDPDELSVWHGTAEVFEAVEGGRVRFADPGHAPVAGIVERAEPQRYLRWRINGDASVVEERFRADGNATRVQVTHRNDEGWAEHEFEAITLGWDESLADLILFLERGVRFTRHMTFKSTLGLSTRDTAAGVEVVAVTPGKFGDSAGLRAGDLLVQLGRAPLFDRSDVALLMREHEPGEVFEVQFVRNGQVMHGVAPLSSRD
jgi:uncharacterized protein YndB with AHSA1/START domain